MVILFVGDKNKLFRMLGIGSGKGEMDVLMINFVVVYLKVNEIDVKFIIYSVVVELSLFFLEKFKEFVLLMLILLIVLVEILFEWW